MTQVTRRLRLLPTAQREAEEGRLLVRVGVVRASGPSSFVRSTHSMPRSRANRHPFELCIDAHAEGSSVAFRTRSSSRCPQLRSWCKPLSTDVAIRHDGGGEQPANCREAGDDISDFREFSVHVTGEAGREPSPVDLYPKWVLSYAVWVQTTPPVIRAQARQSRGCALHQGPAEGSARATVDPETAMVVSRQRNRGRVCVAS
jgi:hypothetical protein